MAMLVSESTPEVPMVNENAEKELLELERRYWQAIKDKDAATVMSLSDDLCLVTGAQGVGVFGREALGEMMKDASWTLRDFDLKDARVRLISDDVAVVAYKVHEELSVDGEQVSLDAADASTWIRRGGRWVCALHTETPAGDPFGRDRRVAPR